MKLTLKQLKQLISEQVEMTMSEGSTGGGDDVETVYEKLVNIWREEAGILSDNGGEIDKILRAKAEELANLTPQELHVRLENEREAAILTLEFLQQIEKQDRWYALDKLKSGL